MYIVPFAVYIVPFAVYIVPFAVYIVPFAPPHLMRIVSSKYPDLVLFAQVAVAISLIHAAITAGLIIKIKVLKSVL